jgi:molybdopterin converting factor small subunit
MQIRIKCFATLSDHTPEGGLLQVPRSATVADVLSLVGLEEKDVKLIFVNSKSAGLDTVLVDDDQLGIFPAVGGG